MTKSAMLAAVAAATATAAGLSAAPGDIVVTAALVKEHFPDVASALIAEGKAEGVKSGAEAERARIAGIEAAALPGYEKIIAAHKADPSKTGADAAMAIIAAEKAARGSQLQALDKDEEQVRVRSQPANPTASADAPALAGKSGVDLWKAEFAGSKDLQAEFASESDYLAFKQASAAGQVKVLNHRTAA